MKDLHYKAYIKKFNNIFDVHTINFANKEVFFSNWVSGRQRWFRFDEVELMEGTGLYDINCNEIFEGFRVSAINVKTQKESEYAVEYSGCRFIFRDTKTHKASVHRNLTDIEIIGDIYIGYSLLKIHELLKRKNRNI